MRNTSIAIGLLALLLATGCTAQATASPEAATPTTPPDSPVSSNDPTAVPTPFPSGVVVTGEAVVDSVKFVTLESFPVQIQAVVRGNLPDGCTSVGEITQSRNGNAYVIHIATIRPRDQMCTQALVPYQQNVALDVYGLPKGVYTVDINGYQATFELQSDNILNVPPPDATATPTAASIQPTSQQGGSGASGIAGQAIVGPMCPVMQANSPCPDQPYQATVQVFDGNGALLTTFTTNAAGFFSVNLPAGTYTLRPLPPSGMPMPFAAEQTVTVVAGQFTQVLIQYDSGIR